MVLGVEWALLSRWAQACALRLARASQSARAKVLGLDVGLALLSRWAQACSLRLARASPSVGE